MKEAYVIISVVLLAGLVLTEEPPSKSQLFNTNKCKVKEMKNPLDLYKSMMRYGSK